jgi:hypothetical protein
MQNPPPPTVQTKASIPTETTVKNNKNGPNKDRTFNEHRKAAKRTLPWDLQAGELDLVPSSAAQAADIPAPASKRPRLENANADLVSTDMQSNDGASIRATPRLWTLEEDAKLPSAVTNTPVKKHGKEYRSIGLQLPRSFRVERKNSVGADGIKSWIPASTGRVDARVNGHQTKTVS